MKDFSVITSSVFIVSDFDDISGNQYNSDRDMLFDAGVRNSGFHGRGTRAGSVLARDIEVFQVEIHECAGSA